MATVQARNKIRLAEVGPTYCSSCFAQNPDKQHVDFGAYYDGPVLDGAKQSQIDDLILCEDCLREAAGLIPGPSAADKERMDRVVEENETLKLANAGQAAYIERLEAAIAVRPETKRGARK